ncbi:MAG: RNA-binding transcriptional accessory protein [bacterium]|nr:RNA-binding transcriptional accessory protein [bacterium]
MLEEKNIKIIAKELNLKINQVNAVAGLLSDEATVPFIARYRKEATGGMDEVAIIAARDRLDQLRDLDKRREAILKSLKAQDKLTPELEKQVMSAETISKLEDIYLPYRPKKRTRGIIAKEKGLEPFAKKIFSQASFDVEKAASEYIDPEKGVSSTEEALQGARDIIAEWTNENSEAREKMRKLFIRDSIISSKVAKGKEEEAAKYRDYFEWSEPVIKAPSHRILAILRGAEEGFLSFHILPDENEAIRLLEKQFIKESNSASEQVKLAVTDCYKRLLSVSMETEMRAIYKKKADEEAINVFAENVRELLLASPLGQKAILAIDPGLRTGCKIVCLDRHGSLIHSGTIFPIEPHNKKEESEKTIKELCEKHRIEAIAIGNGTGGRETLAFCKGLGLDELIIMMVNESGASVYSASEVARREFPDYDVTVRGAVSIGRRFMDPLAELVKIDPKAIGVGQYQHDVDQKALKKSLDDVVMSCVNAVGVEVNTASSQLLSYVSGLSKKAADGFINYREKEGAFRSHEEFNKVPGMGPKTFEQAAGFLRIRDAENPLDASAVHPESYHIVKMMASDLSCTVSDLIANKETREKIELKKYITENVGMPTLQDILQELAKPGRDPRKEFEIFSFSNEVNDITDLKSGMKLPGVITNVTAFGAFIDIGVHQDGLVHISQLSDNFVSNPHEAAKVQQKVDVTVLEIDLERKRISLSMKKNPDVDRKPGQKPGKVDKSGNSPKKSGKRKPAKKVKRVEQEKIPPPHSPFADLAKILKPEK